MRSVFFDELNSIYDKHNEIRDELLYYLNLDVRTLIKTLHQDTVQTRSNADGKFILKLDREKDYILTGYGERQAGTSSETYNWIVPLHLAKYDTNVEVFFSNLGLTDRIYGDREIPIKVPDQLTKIRKSKNHPKNSPYVTVKID